MNRKTFLKAAMTILPLGGISYQLNELNKYTKDLPKSPKMPVLFLGHGSPMNAIEENEFVQGFRSVAKTLPTPTAIVCISAHWETRGTWVTAMPSPKTIHDFGGFPKELFEVQYPAPGSPELAQEISSLIQAPTIHLDHDHWGLDHGAWSVIKHLYPKANIPVIQLSLDVSMSPQQHYDLARQLAPLRERGILIIGSGNMVHNLRMVAWDKLNEANYAYDWAQEAKTKMNDYLLNNVHESLINYQQQGQAFKLAIPTPEHYLPMLYSIALKDKKDNLELFNDKAVAGSLTMTSFKITS